MMPPKDVDQDALHVRIGEDDLEGFRYLLLACAAAHIEEVGGLGAIELDDVHCRHGEAGAVHHAADGAVEFHIGQVEAGGHHLGRVFSSRSRRLTTSGWRKRALASKFTLASRQRRVPSFVT
jgi:hypothetical protein